MIERKTKSLSPERTAAARAFVQALVANQFGGNIKAAAEATGVSYSILYEFHEGTGGIGNRSLERLADFTGRSMDEIMGRSGEDSEPRHMNLPGWPEARAAIELRHDIPPAIWDKAGRARGLAPMSPVTVEWVHDLVTDLLKHTPREELVRLENERLAKRVQTQRRRVENKAERATDTPAPKKAKR